MTDKPHTIEVTSIYGYHTKQGLVELVVDGGAKIQMDVRKTREVIAMLQEAAEAAITDQILVMYLRDRVGMSIETAGAALLDFRELRQGSRKVVYVN